MGLISPSCFTRWALCTPAIPPVRCVCVSVCWMRRKQASGCGPSPTAVLFLKECAHFVFCIAYMGWGRERHSSHTLSVHIRTPHTRVCRHNPRSHSSTFFCRDPLCHCHLNCCWAAVAPFCRFCLVSVDQSWSHGSLPSTPILQCSGNKQGEMLEERNAAWL